MLEVSKLEVLNDNILITGVQPEKIDRVVKGVTQDDKPQEGKVLKVGPGRVLDNGTRSVPMIKKGMYVLFNEHTTTKFNIGGRVYYVLREEDVVGYQ